MSILIDEETKVIVQGITGSMAQTDVELNLKQGVQIVAGVTPGKGGTEVFGVPVFNTMKEALEEVEANTSVIYVPPFGAKNALIEAVECGMELVLVFTENIPQHDFIYCLNLAQRKGVRIVGPNSNGIISPGKSRLGGLGGDTPEKMFIPGKVGILSRSGGMGGEIAWMLRNKEIGISTCVSVGGDRIIGTPFKELLALFQQDEETEVVVIFGEVGGGYEEEAADFIANGGIDKPVVAFIAGKFIDQMPEGVSFGHSGALIEGGTGSASQKIEALRRAGVIVADRIGEVPELVGEALQRKGVPSGDQNK